MLPALNLKGILRAMKLKRESYSTSISKTLSTSKNFLKKPVVKSWQSKPKFSSKSSISILSLPYVHVLHHVSIAFVCMLAICFSFSLMHMTNVGSRKKHISTVIKYDLPELLNVSGMIDVNKSVTKAMLKRRSRDSLAFFSMYSSNDINHDRTMIKSSCSFRPLKSHLLSLMATYNFSIASKEHVQHHMLNAVMKNDTLTIQFCTVDDASTSIEKKTDHSVHAQVEDYLKRIERYIHVEQYNRALIVPCSSSGPVEHLSEYMKARLERSIKRSSFSVDILCLTKEIQNNRKRQSFRDEDNRLFILHKAANLAVDGGSADSALSALVSSGFAKGVYIDEKRHRYMQTLDVFKHAVYVRYTADIDSMVSETRLPLKYAINGLHPVVETCCDFQQFGHDDGAKVLCTNAIRQPSLEAETQVEGGTEKEKCWVLSIGCSNRWDFETDVVLRTKCSVHVFDCTGNFPVPVMLRGRVTFDKLCIGNPEQSSNFNYTKGFRTWDNVMQIGARRANVAPGTPPQVVKMDVEGWEFPVLRGLAEARRNHVNMPKQMVIEVHSATNFEVGKPYVVGPGKGGGKYVIFKKDVEAMMEQMSDIGFDLVHRADNPYCGHCSEVTFLQKSAFPRVI